MMCSELYQEYQLNKLVDNAHKHSRLHAGSHESIPIASHITNKWKEGFIPVSIIKLTNWQMFHAFTCVRSDMLVITSITITSAVCYCKIYVFPERFIMISFYSTLLNPSSLCVFRSVLVCLSYL